MTSILLRCRKAPLVGATGLLGAVLLLVLVGFNPAVHVTASAAASTTGGCPQFMTAPGAAPAFCDPLSTPAGTGNRSGDLNGVVWGVSRATSDSNITQGISYDWAAVDRSTCGKVEQVQPEHDVAICNGQMVEASNDSGGQTVLAAYPKQPFDFAGRTGTVEFDVSDNTQGPHAAWPAFAITDQPVPAPDPAVSGISDYARNSVGVSFALASCNGTNCSGSAQSTCVGVNQIYDTANYQFSYQNVHQDGCVKASSGPGINNHVEVRVSSSGIWVYMSDAGNPASLKLVADSQFSMPLTRGLIWLEDVHYNADKFNSQQTNTFSWANVAFDGPVLPRDLGFDVLDNTDPGGTADNGLPMTNLGYPIPGGGSLTLDVKNVRGTANAKAGLLELTYWPTSSQTLTYSVNGNPAHTFAWPFGNQATYQSQTVAMPVPLGEIHDGTNTITLSTSDPGGVSTANYDLILAGAGGLVPPGQP